jgi:hypothetical protein
MKPTDQQLETIKLNLPEIAVTYEVESYNTKRYSKPWIAKITSWNVGSYPTLYFGASSTYVAEISAKPGDIIKYGQKDYRNLPRSDNEFGLVLETGEIERITENQAKILFRSRTQIFSKAA